MAIYKVSLPEAVSMKLPIFPFITRTERHYDMPFHFSPLISLCSANMCTVHSHDDDDDDDYLYHNGSIRLAACFKSITNVNSFSHLKHTQTRIKQVFLGNISELLPCQ